MRLIIAEKPSLGRKIAQALNVKKNKNGYIESESYIITWALGHLYQLYDVSDYLGEKTAWKDIPLPFIPEDFKYKYKKNKETKVADEGVVAQVKIIKELLERSDVEEIIHCGDSDREGQLIIDNLLEILNNKKPVKRLWLPEQTEETIRTQIKLSEDNKKYTDLHNEGIARTYIDWLLGINLSVFLKNKTGVRLNVGRVMIPIVKFIYDRDMEIKNFVSKTYYQAEGILKKDGIDITLTASKKIDEKLEADNYSKLISGNIKVCNVEEKEIIKQASKLFSLSNLQSFLSKHHKIDFSSSMEVIQGLYEKGLITYPRTNTEYLAENEKDKVKKIIEIFSKYPLEFKDTKKIFDSSKIESHSAIIPTGKEAELIGNEKLIYEVIKNRFISNFLSEKTVTKKLTVELVSINNPECIFKLSGETLVNEGFYKYEPRDFKDPLPSFTKDEEFNITFNTREKKTQPKKKVTEEELSNYLKNPFRTEKTTEDEEYKAMFEGVEIGTEATRTPTIEKCKAEGYFSQSKGSFSIEEKGIYLIETLNKLEIDLYAARTMVFSKALKKVYKEEMQIKDLIKLTEEEIGKIVNSNVEIEKKVEEDTREIIGICPMCGKNVYERKSKAGKVFYSCDGYKDGCTFTLWEEMKYFDNTLKITKTRAKNLIAGKKVSFKLIGKNKKEYEGYLKLKITDYNNKKYVNFENAGYPEKNKQEKK